MLIVSGRVVLALILVCCIGIQCMYGIERHKDAGLGVSENGLPMVTTDYLEAGADHRVLAVSAETRNIVNYAVMRTSRGDLSTALRSSGRACCPASMMRLTNNWPRPVPRCCPIPTKRPSRPSARLDSAASTWFPRPAIPRTTCRMNS